MEDAETYIHEKIRPKKLRKIINKKNVMDEEESTQLESKTINTFNTKDQTHTTYPYNKLEIDSKSLDSSSFTNNQNFAENYFNDEKTIDVILANTDISLDQ